MRTPLAQCPGPCDNTQPPHMPLCYACRRKVPTTMLVGLLRDYKIAARHPEDAQLREASQRTTGAALAAIAGGQGG